ncbi:DUF6089 family protein [Hymenobacter negativus]|uniref:DUF6089 domain-containing protein n=1 Tax=Hymenobacter negativus TaxID=2795026 RepID=A0ABS0Q9R5_9BACT|nr:MULTISPECIES: DUF6089 family protein [Bacteria]MBH8559212.1 hypothetical protein [Hymenobacter negativus]MBH8569959.1 hypothetical protein [Hymenobacter negativus]MBR7209698.1 hypothetical protein [Microvirga sp. STS02]
MKNIFTYSTAVVLGLALVATPEADAQQFSKRKQYNSIGFSLNAMNYFGDLTPVTSFTSLRLGATRVGAGVSITRRFYPRLSGRFGLSYGRISGDDSFANDQDPDARFRNNRNMNFRNDVLEASAVAIIDLIENRNNYLKRPDFVPYVFAGVAGFYHNPQGLDSRTGNYVDLQPLRTEGQATAYGKTQFSIPFGGGIRYRINRNFDASLEIGWRKTFTDYLDDVGGKYADPSKLTTDASAYFGRGITKSLKDGTGTFNGFTNPGEARGDTGNKTDWYIVTGVTLNYILTPRIKNPKFR